MKKLLTTAICAVGLATGAHAATASFDFVALAAGNEGGIEGNSYTDNGLTVTITSSHNAYLDDLSNGKPGGLGVCKVLNGANQCNPGSDDNIQAGEFVTLTFSHFVELLPGVSFNDANHNDLNSSSKMAAVSLIREDGSNFGPQDFTFSALSSLPYVSSSSITFGYGSADAAAFYLSAFTANFDQNNQVPPIPLPAGLPLLVGALGVLGVAARRKKAA